MDHWLVAGHAPCKQQYNINCFLSQDSPLSSSVLMLLPAMGASLLLVLQAARVSGSEGVTASSIQVYV